MKIILFDYTHSMRTLLIQYWVSGEVATCVRMLNMISIFIAFVKASYVCTVSIKSPTHCYIARLKFFIIDKYFFQALIVKC